MSAMKPHKHAELIKAWADGAEIEFYSHDDKWFLVENPNWESELEYRIKPADVVSIWAGNSMETLQEVISPIPEWKFKLKIISDGETGKLKDAEVLK